MRLFLKVFTVLFVGFAVGGALWLAYQAHDRPTELSILVGPTGSDDHALMTAFARRMAEARPRVRITIRTVKGPGEAAEAFEQNTADLAVIRGDLPVPGAARALAIMQKYAVVLVANDGPKIKIEGFGDLKGRKLGVIGTPGANDRLIDRLCAHSGLAKTDVARIPLTREEVVDAIRLRRVDAILIAMPLQGPTIQAFNAAVARAFKGVPNFVELDAEAITRSASGYETEDIPAGAFRATPAVPAEELSSLFFNHLLVVRSTVDDSVAAALARHLFESRAALQAEIPAAQFIQAAKTEKDAAVPIHPGVAAYLDGSEKTFFDRHGDALFYGSMLFSLLGTGTLAAWRAVTQRFSAAMPDSVSRLWALAQGARQAATAEELEQLETELFTEFDRLVQAFARRRISEGDLAAAATVFGQTVALARERRRTLAAAPGTSGPALVRERASS